MNSTLVIAKKEFRDYIKSKRFLTLFILFLLFYISGVSILISVGITSIKRGEIYAIRDLLSTLSFISPLIGIAFGFDAISDEREKGTLKILLAQPIFRDSIINGKLISFLLVSSLSLFSATLTYIGILEAFVGIPITLDDVLRILLVITFALLLSLSYYSISLLFSVILRKSSHSAILSLTIWIIIVLILPFLSSVIAYAVLGPPPRIRHISKGSNIIREYAIKRARIASLINSFSLNHHFQEIASALLGITIFIGPLSKKNLSIAGALLQTSESSLILILTSLITFILSYILFVKKEER